MIGKKMYNFLKDYRHFIMVDSFKNPFTAFYVLDDTIVFNHNEGEKITSDVLNDIFIEECNLNKNIKVKHKDIKGIVVDVNSKMIILSKDDDFIK